MALVEEKAAVIRDSTQNCSSYTERMFFVESDRLLQYLKAMQCSNQYRSNYCDLDAMVTLTSLASAPFGTSENVETICG